MANVVFIGPTLTTFCYHRDPKQEQLIRRTAIFRSHSCSSRYLHKAISDYDYDTEALTLTRPSISTGGAHSCSVAPGKEAYMHKAVLNIANFFSRSGTPGKTRFLLYILIAK
jgi:hypothetical protein